jgi:RNA polymerase primary sigma factor
MSGDELQNYDLSVVALLNRPDVQVLSAQEERALLLELDGTKKQLLEQRRTAGGLQQPKTEATEGADVTEIEEIQEIVRGLLQPSACHTVEHVKLAQLARQYNETRSRLAMANLRLVAHVARKYRNRGISSSDLLQEGFCGLLKGIDRFDPSKDTRLASYAVWWIRQALQRAVAAGAYPVRLNPRHLQQLAGSHADPAKPRKPGRKSRSGGSSTTIQQIQSATRPTVSLNSSVRGDEGLTLLGSLTYPTKEEEPSHDLDEYLVMLIEQLKPREKVVLQLRFGLGGKECHSLSQVSEVLDVSKERIRQIQEGALQKLRSMAEGSECCEAVL